MTYSLEMAANIGEQETGHSSQRVSGTRSNRPWHTSMDYLLEEVESVAGSVLQRRMPSGRFPLTHQVYDLAMSYLAHMQRTNKVGEIG